MKTSKVARFLARNFPLLNCLFWFAWKSHWEAIWKFLLLWLFATLPLLLAALVPAAQSQEKPFFEAWWDSVLGFLQAEALFVYTTAYVAPFLSIFLIGLARKHGKYFSGHETLAVLAFITLVLATFVFGLEKSSDPQFVAISKVISSNFWPWLYLTSLLCGYMGILHSDGEPSKYFEPLDDSTKALSAELTEWTKSKEHSGNV